MSILWNFVPFTRCRILAIYNDFTWNWGNVGTQVDFILMGWGGGGVHPD
jgi:hypothetical protein